MLILLLITLKKRPLPYSNGLIIISYNKQPDKCHLLISSNENITVKISEYEIQKSQCEELLGVELDWKVNCDDHISNGCEKARGELNALIRIEPFLGLSKRLILMNGFP